MNPTRIFCPSCSAFHDGEVALDATGWPVVTWAKPHDPDAVALRDHLDAIVEEGGQALALVLDAGDWTKVEEVCSGCWS